MKKLFIFLSLFLMLFFNNCMPKRYKITSTHRTEVVKNNYSINDSLFLSNLIFCNNRGYRSLWMEDIKMQAVVETDTFFDIFYKSISNLNLPLIVKEPINHCDTILDYIFPLKVEKIDVNRINEILSQSTTDRNKLIIFPIIHIDNITQRAVFVSSIGMPGGGYYMRDILLKLAIYIIKNNEIIYLKSARYGPVSSETATPEEEPPLKLKQKHWDNLVALAMRDYIKRMK